MKKRISVILTLIILLSNQAVVTETNKTTGAMKCVTLDIPENISLEEAFNRLSKRTNIPIMIEEVSMPSTFPLTRIKVSEKSFTNETSDVILDYLKKSSKGAFSYDLRNNTVINIKATALKASSPLDVKIKDFDDHLSLSCFLEKLFKLDSRFIPVYTQDNGELSLSKTKGVVAIKNGQIRDALNVFCNSADLQWKAVIFKDEKVMLFFKKRAPTMPPK